MKSVFVFGLMLSMISCENFDVVMTKLNDLEFYANEFYSKVSQKISVDNLILSYIRTGRYNSTEWTLAAGETPVEFINYTEAQDNVTGKKTSDLRNYKEGDIVLPDPDGTKTDFVHMVAVMNGFSHLNSFTDDLVNLQGWGGDTAQLFQDIFSLTGLTLEELVAKAKEKIGVSGGFGKADLISDLDAVGYYSLKLNNKDKPYSTIFKQYLKGIDLSKRVGGIIAQVFPNLSKQGSTQNDYRDSVFAAYDKNSYIKIWECKQGLREEGLIGCYTPGDVKEGKANNRKAAVYAFADFLFENKPNYNRFEEAMTKLEDLENYAKNYYGKTSQNISVDNLILSYIRTEKYNSSEWTKAAGETPNEFISYVLSEDTKAGKSTSDLRKYEVKDIVLPDSEGSTTDFVHMFAVMNSFSYQKSLTNQLAVLQGWGGDTVKLFQDIFNLTNLTLEELIVKAKEFLGNKGGFDIAVLNSDLDAIGYFTLKKKNVNKTYSSVFKDYLNNINITNRVGNLLAEYFPSLCNEAAKQNDYRNSIYNTYDKNTEIKKWECKQGLREFGSDSTCNNPGKVKEGKDNNRKAAVYAFADFLFENKPKYKPLPSSSGFNKYCFLLLFISLFLIF